MIASLFERSAHLIAAYLDTTTSQLGISQAEAHVLVALKREGPLPIGALRHEFGHKPSTLTNVVDRLERRELVRRATNPDDRRSVLIQLTGSGDHAADHVISALAQLDGQIRANVVARDIEGLRTVVASIETAVDRLHPE